jgi:large subunit ribosomal protein L24
MAPRIRRNDEVVVIAGKDKGARGKVLKVLPDTDRVIIAGINTVKRHQRPTQQQGGIIEKEAAIHISNVMLLDTKSDKPTRVRMGKDKDGHKVRISVKTGTVLEE